MFSTKLHFLIKRKSKGVYVRCFSSDTPEGLSKPQISALHCIVQSCFSLARFML